MKTNFRKTLSVLLAILMVASIFSITAFAATYTIKFDKGSGSDATAIEGADLSPLTKENGETVILPGALFERPHYYQDGWSTNKSGSSKSYGLGAKFTKNENRTLYPYWKAVTYTVTYDLGEYGENQTVDVVYNKNTTLLKTIPVQREGYSLGGWTDGTTNYDLGKSYKVLGDVTFYPIWIKDDYTYTISDTELSFGSVCIGYDVPNSQEITFTNEGNVTYNFVLPTPVNYNIKLVSGMLAVKPGATVKFSIQPKADLAKGDYSETFVFATGYSAVELEIVVNFVVQDHYYTKYESDNNASYTADGTKHAECANGCGFILTGIPDPGTQKVYSAANNDAVGISKEYIHHRTVRFTAYGSGMDDTEGYLTKRFRPVAWYVDDEFNGEFTGNKYENGYDVTFTHTVFGKYALIINFVEEEVVYNEETDEYEWVATGVTDEKVFEYTVGTNEYEEQEIVRPNTILSIIFGLFQEFLKLLGIGG